MAVFDSDLDEMARLDSYNWDHPYGLADLARPTDPDLGLTEEEEEALEARNHRAVMVRDRVRGVVLNLATGFYLWGEGGIGKSWEVERELARSRASWVRHNTRLSAAGLFRELAERPDHVHVIEDAQNMLRGGEAATATTQLLLAALWAAHPDGPRLVTWRVAGRSQEVDFTGGVILINNAPLDDSPTLRALKTRISTLELATADDEVAALGKVIALRGYRHALGTLHAVQCLEVHRLVRQECLELQRTYDLRALTNGMADRLQFEFGHAETHWVDLVKSRLREKMDFKRRPVTQAERLESDRQVAWEISLKPINREAKIAEFRQRTGYTKNVYYERLREAKAARSLPQGAGLS